MGDLLCVSILPLVDKHWKDGTEGLVINFDLSFMWHFLVSGWDCGHICPAVYHLLTTQHS